MDDIKTICEIVAEEFGLPATAILSKTRKREYIEPRQIIHYLCRKHTRYSFYEIADYFNIRCHATVYHSVKVVSDCVAIYPDYRKRVESIRARVLSYDPEKPAISGGVAYSFYPKQKIAV